MTKSEEFDQIKVTHNVLGHLRSYRNILCNHGIDISKIHYKIKMQIKRSLKYKESPKQKHLEKDRIKAGIIIVKS